jgi:hypothetical protein
VQDEDVVCAAVRVDVDAGAVCHRLEAGDATPKLLQACAGTHTHTHTRATSGDVLQLPFFACVAATRPDALS